MRVVLAFAFVAVFCAGCGPDGRRVRAMDALESTRTALTDLDSRTSGSERPAEVSDALDRATVRLEETEHAYDLWSGTTGRIAYERTAACLAAALDTLREALVAAHIEVTVELETAEVALGTTTEHRCAHAEGGE
jgi:hypothetical protein